MLGLDPMFSDVLVISGADEFVRRVRSVLLAAGYTVRSSGTAAAGLQAARRTPPDLVLQDTHLPDGDGYAVVRALKAEAGQPFLPVIMVSARDDPVEIAAALPAGEDLGPAAEAPLDGERLYSFDEILNSGLLDPAALSALDEQLAGLWSTE